MACTILGKVPAQKGLSPSGVMPYSHVQVVPSGFPGHCLTRNDFSVTFTFNISYTAIILLLFIFRIAITINYMVRLSYNVRISIERIRTL
jgi:hypothetical protein